jgi:hypothetical protein
VSPLQQRLALARAAERVARLAKALASLTMTSLAMRR